MGALFCLIGLLLLGLGVALFFMRWSARKHMALAKGFVTGVESEAGMDGRLYRPVVRFETADKYPVEFTEKIATNVAPRAGETVNVLYEPNNPMAATIDTPFRRWVLPGIFTFVGGLVFLIGLVLTVLGKRF